MTSPMYCSGVMTSTLHDRLEDRRVGLLAARAQRHRAGDLEGHLVGVDLVVGAVDERHLDVDDRDSRRDAAVHGLADALFDRRDELARDAALLISLTNSKPLPIGCGSISMTTWPYWPRPPDWRMNLPSSADLLADRLAVGDLGLADVGLDLELALHAVDDDLEVQLAHAGDDGLAGLVVGLDAERRVLLGQALHGVGHLLLVGLRLGLDGDRDDGLGEGDLLEQDGLVLVAERVAARAVLEAPRSRAMSPA